MRGGDDLQTNVEKVFGKDSAIVMAALRGESIERKGLIQIHPDKCKVTEENKPICTKLFQLFSDTEDGKRVIKDLAAAKALFGIVEDNNCWTETREGEDVWYIRGGEAVWEIPAGDTVCEQDQAELIAAKAAKLVETETKLRAATALREKLDGEAKAAAEAAAKARATADAASAAKIREAKAKEEEDEDDEDGDGEGEKVDEDFFAKRMRKGMPFGTQAGRSRSRRRRKTRRTLRPFRRSTRGRRR